MIRWNHILIEKRLWLGKFLERLKSLWYIVGL
jgi:hypothetical protein